MREEGEGGGDGGGMEGWDEGWSDWERGGAAANLSGVRGRRERTCRRVAESAEMSVV